MFATDERFTRSSLRRMASVLVILMFCVPSWWTHAPCGEESCLADADHVNDSDMPAVSALPEPAAGLRLISVVAESSSAGAMPRLLRPPRA